MRLFFVKDFLDLVFPRNCLMCGRSLYDSEQNLCIVCKGTLPVTSYHLRPIDNDLCDKVKGLSTVGMVMAFLKFTKGGSSQKLLHQLKYRNKPQLGQELGLMYGKILNENGFSRFWDLIVPVPLHPLKQSRRGYNQSEKFGLGLSEALSVKFELSLVRGKFTETQTQKSRLERMYNVDDVFQIAPYSSITSKSILLVDDVMTTGATLSACANVLLANGAKNVDLVTIAAGG
ncbi:ComF family protein [Algoriphagus winogradskyi]|uniref:ComF family protein n=1 Tax=Algoriphagus winogradskyi TaxID=237017 RepID=A0ABY1NLA1_9BACT|nr:phosphoribosyltransferase family protein [Algoriphagus winogradskyi]SMP12719.1 comF family protein [Algoriphagus winogradskyi]